MSNARKWTQVAAMAAMLLSVSVAPAAAQRISADLETSQLSVVNAVAEATFKIVVKNDEPDALTGVYLVFDDGFEVSVGDVAGEASGSSEATTRTFDLSEQAETQNVSLPATLKYAVGGSPVELAVTITLRLGQ